jgi:hypothetical protein
MPPAILVLLPPLECVRQGENERGALTGLGFNPDAAPVPLYDTLANGKTNARPRDLLAMQPLEGHEDFLVVLRFDSDSIIGNRESQIAVHILYGDVNSRG